MKLITMAITLILSLNVGAQSLTKTIPLSKSIETISVDISKTKVKLTPLGYSFPVVKILVPEMADVTLLNHRNLGEEAPCLASYEALTADQIIQNDPATESIDFTIERFKVLTPLFQSQQCQVEILETLNAKIRGFNFTHSVQNSIGLRHIDDCR